MIYIVNFHYIRPAKLFTGKGIFGITPQQFAKILKCLSSYGQLINETELVYLLDSNQNNLGNYIYITFDDGFKEQIFETKDICKEFNLKPTIFINTRNLEKPRIQTVHLIQLINSIEQTDKILKCLKEEFKNYFEKVNLRELVENAKNHYIYDNESVAFLKYVFNFCLDNIIVHKFCQDYLKMVLGVDVTKYAKKLYLNIDEIQQHKESFFFGSHGYEHLPIGKLKLKDRIQQIKSSKIMLNSLGLKCRGFSFPYGSEEAIADSWKLLKPSNYDYGLSTNKEFNCQNQNPFLLNRFDNNDAPLGKNFEKHKFKWNLQNQNS